MKMLDSGGRKRLARRLRCQAAWLETALGIFVCLTAGASDLFAQTNNMAIAGWEKYSGNPVLGGQYGTCFDISVLKEGGAYRM